MEIALLTIAILWAGWGGWQRNRQPMPHVARFSPMDIAWLRGGWRGGVQLALFQLWQENHLEIKHDPLQGIMLVSLLQRPPATAPFLHRMLHQHLRLPVSLANLLADRSLRQQNSMVNQTQEIPLVAWGLWRGARGRANLVGQMSMAAVAIVALLASPQGNKHELGATLILVGFFLLLVFQPWRRDVITRRGKQVLTQVGLSLSTAYPHIKDGRIPAEEVDPLLLVAFFGLVAGIPWLPFDLPWEEYHRSLGVANSGSSSDFSWDGGGGDSDGGDGDGGGDGGGGGGGGD